MDAYGRLGTVNLAVQDGALWDTTDPIGSMKIANHRIFCGMLKVSTARVLYPKYRVSRENAERSKPRQSPMLANWAKVRAAFFTVSALRTLILAA